MPNIQTNDVGQCYLATYEMLLDKPDDAVLVHGYPRCTGDEHRGQKMGHAWIEVERLGQTWCIDHRFPEQMVHERIYYGVGKIERAECKRYTRRQALSLVHRTGRPGPWGRQPKDALFAEDVA